jgi:hypothetical protein
MIRLITTIVQLSLFAVIYPLVKMMYLEIKHNGLN